MIDAIWLLVGVVVAYSVGYYLGSTDCERDLTKPKCQSYGKK